MGSPPAKRSRRSDGDERDRRDYDRHGRSSDYDRHGSRRDYEDRRGGEREGRNRERERERERERHSRSANEDRGRRDGASRNADVKEVEKWRAQSTLPKELRDAARNAEKDQGEARNGTMSRGEGEELGHGVRAEETVKDELDNQMAGERTATQPRGKNDSIALMEEAEAALEAKEQEKEKASFEYSGKLAVETNKVNGVALQFTEPPDARQPTVRWRLYVFKDGEPLDDPLFIHRQSCYLFGRERKVADIPIDHPSCSKQHAVIQYRLVEKEVDGLMSKKIRPYIMDLGSTNKTFLNGEAIDSQRYYELMEKDTIKFGNSSREYVLLHESSQ